MKIYYLITFLSLMIYEIGYSQKDTIIYTKANNKPALKDDATNYTQIKQIGRSKFKVLSYSMKDGIWIKSSLNEIVQILDNSSIRIETGNNKKNKTKITRKFSFINNNYHFQDISKSGKIIQEGITKTILPLYLNGELKKYYTSGKIKSIEIYKNNQMISNQNWMENGDKYIDNIFSSVDIMPEYPGGEKQFLKYISNSLRYPEIVANAGIQGKVFMQFVVNENGFMEGVRIAKGVDPFLDKEAKKVVESVKEIWTPGKLDGKIVKVLITFPVIFVLE